MKLTIKASFLDCINMYLHRKKELNILHKKQIQIEKDLTELNKKELIDLLQGLENYYFENNCIYYSRYLNEIEIKKRKKDIKQGIKYDINRLKNWSNLSKENENQIKTYLNVKNIYIKSINS